VGTEGIATGGARAWDSLLSAPEFTALAGAGFDPVGHVMGTAVVHLGFASEGGRCSGTPNWTPGTDLASSMSGPFNLLLRKTNGLRRLALTRAIEECTALGGDGIVGVTVLIKPFPAGGTELTVMGTAVRARSSARPATPFSSHLSAQDFVKLLQAGWVPTALVFGIALGTRHDDRHTSDETKSTTGNREVRSYTRLVLDIRSDAREQLRRAVLAQAGDGVVVDEMTLRIGVRECPAVEGQNDHTAEATILGTSIVAFERPATGKARPPLAIMHLNQRGTATAEPEPVEAESPMEEGGTLDRRASERSTRHTSRGGFSLSDPSGRTSSTSDEWFRADLPLLGRLCGFIPAGSRPRSRASRNITPPGMEYLPVAMRVGRPGIWG
jgi:hypothetical protein